jgi:hypothetical protein
VQPGEAPVEENAMRRFRLLSFAAIAAGLLLVPVQLSLAGGDERAPGAKPGARGPVRKKIRSGTAPAVPSGVPRTDDAPGAGAYDGTGTIKTYRNAVGDTVYEISASRFDVSEPLAALAAKAPPEPQVEFEPSVNPLLPSWRRIRSSQKDPVVQTEIPPPGEPGKGLSPLGAPATGFNFLGAGTGGASPSDSNGSVGNNQFVETVNIRYQAWSLNRATNVATSVLGPTSISTLWSGFGGACQAQNSGDPIVLYDKLANRWLISQFTSTASSGTYYQCVALSTTANATGSYYRWAFAVPNGHFGDYPHFGAWTDAYYMMAHAFLSTAGGYVAAIFAAMDRVKMLDGDPTATWQVIEDPTEGGHMPADLDGFAPPPTGAPGIFLSLHSTGMFVYRMKVDFVQPSKTVKTKQASVAVAPAEGACGGGGACIPQPGTTQTVGSLADRLMFRAAYRNFIDHESLVVSHSVDPAIAGVVSGVRWYDFRLSGTPDATCPSYPCIHQQGTIADAANGRSRWMPSVAMDGAENILVGYSATGKTAGTENHTIRFTGRTRSDPAGTMTVPETTLGTGTANNTNSRWGDYTSMSVDPYDDCTFWYVNQYFTTAGAWSTRIASAAWPPGNGDGECPPTACGVRPVSAPAIGSATVSGDNRITVTWTGLSPAPGAYAVERADGACNGEGLYRPLGAVAGNATSFTDTSVQGGLAYSYRVIAADDVAGRCQALVASGCVEVTATGTCNLLPSFGGATGAVSRDRSNCGVTVGWTPAATACPLTPNMRYNVFRGTVPDFIPSPSNRIATCVPGPSSYVDTANLWSGTTYYYVVRAEDDSTGHGGACGGNEETNGVVVSGTAHGAGLGTVPGTWTDGGGDVTSQLRLNAAGSGDTGNAIWRIVRAADDSGANHTPGGAYAYRNAGPAATDTYPPDECAEMQTPLLTAGAATVRLQYWERHQLEYHWDGVAVEYSVNGGAWTDAPAPSNATGPGCAASDDTTGWETMSCTQDPPLNGCGYPATKNALNGPLGSGSTCSDWSTGGTVPAYAHRCHPVTGLAPGDSIRFRWRFASDPGLQFAGFYLDDIAVADVLLPNSCTPDVCGALADGSACDDGNACTTGDLCAGGTCMPGAPIPAPAEVAGIGVESQTGTTLTWTALPGTVTYDVASSTLADLRANGTTMATCLGNDIAGTSVRAGRSDPAPEDGYYYLVRAQSACASGTYGFDSSLVERVPADGCP